MDIVSTSLLNIVYPTSQGRGKQEAKRQAKVGYSWRRLGCMRPHPEPIIYHI